MLKTKSPGAILPSNPLILATSSIRNKGFTAPVIPANRSISVGAIIRYLEANLSPILKSSK
jgi:hypothetical protein